MKNLLTIIKSILFLFIGCCIDIILAPCILLKGIWLHFKSSIERNIDIKKDAIRVRYIKGRINNLKCPEFFSFAPNKDVDGNSDAYNALSYSLDCNKKSILNIAISGPFGAGKSSLWLSFKELFLSKECRKVRSSLPTEDEIVEISLVKFESNKEDKKRNETKGFLVNISNSNLDNLKSEKNDNPQIINANNINDSKSEEKKEYEIEKAILQQLLFSVDSETIPCLDSYKISEGRRWQKFFISLLISIVLFGGLIYLLEDKVFCSLQSFDFYGYEDYITRFIIGMTFIVMAILDYYLYRYFIKAGNIHICNVSFKGLDLSFEQSNGSLINQNYSAIVYFFEKTKKKVVVFEDLDRFSSNKIFVKLHELNTILNKCPNINKPIKFVYMVKENLFTKYERTKFFQIIVPVLPVVNMETCADYLIKEKKKNVYLFKLMNKCEKLRSKYEREENKSFKKIKKEIEDLISDINSATKTPTSLLIKIDDKLLRIVGNHINDLRIVYDCLNEFKIYKKQIEKNLKNLKIDDVDNKIFAMVVYKNYYPQDFEDLHRRKGYLYEICKNYKYGKMESRNESVIEILDFDHPENKNLKDLCDDKKESRWIYRQCLKAELKFKYNDENEDKIEAFEKAENRKIPCLLFDLIHKDYIDTNCEFYISRKYLGDLTMNDWQYFIIVQSNSNPDFRLEIQKPKLIESKILDYQWFSISSLNFRMFAYELNSVGENEIEKKEHIRGLISAMIDAERMNKKFFEQFVEYLDNEIQGYSVELQDEFFTINKSVHSLPKIKEKFFYSIFENMNNDTLKILFGE